MELFKLLGKIVIDSKEANDDIDETKEKAKESSDSMTGAFKKIGGAVAAYFTVDTIKNFGAGCITAAADASAASSQFAQVFGDLEGKAGKSLTSIADNAGISENRMKGSFTKIAAFAKTTGMDTEDALGLSERAMVAVADSAAFYDRSLEDTTESLQSFLKGNYENDSALGLSCTEVTRNEAANKLYGKSFQDLSEAQKQLTLLQMVEDANKASGALGQAARESDTWTNVTGNLKQSWTDFQAVIGANILPKAVGVVKSLAEKVTELSAKVPEMVEWFKEYKDVLGFVAVAIGTVVAGVTAYNVVQTVKLAMDAAEVTTLGALIKMKLASAAATLAAVAPYVLIAAAIAAVIAIGVALYKNWDTIKAKCAQLVANIKEKFNEMKQAVAEKFEAMKQAVSQKIEAMKQAVSNKFSAIKQGISNIMDGIRNTVSNAWDRVRSTVSGAINGVKSTISSGLNTAKNTVSSVLGGIKEKFTSIFNSAKTIVKNAIDTIKGYFDFDWSLPKIKLPHISISGKFSLDPPSVPKFSIEWYKKAMDNAMILNSPTIFGYGGGKFLGGGEAGSEVVSGADTLMGMIENAVAGQNGQIAVILMKILDAVVTMDENMGGNMREALAGTAFEINRREFARLVKAVD